MLLGVARAQWERKICQLVHHFIPQERKSTCLESTNEPDEGGQACPQHVAAGKANSDTDTVETKTIPFCFRFPFESGPEVC